MPNQPPIHDRSQLGTLPGSDRLDAARHWQRRVDAGVIGAPRRPMPPGQLASIRRSGAIFRSGALYAGRRASGLVAGGAR